MTDATSQDELEQLEYIKLPLVNSRIIGSYIGKDVRLVGVLTSLEEPYQVLAADGGVIQISCTKPTTFTSVNVTIRGIVKSLTEMTMISSRPGLVDDDGNLLPADEIKMLNRIIEFKHNPRVDIKALGL